MSYSPKPDVPILVETLARPSFPMVRCHYLAVEFDDPSRGWSITIGQMTSPFLMLALAGIVQQPFGAAHFDNYPLIEDFFQRVEGLGGLANFEDLWLPEFLFVTAPKVGDVYRVELALFRAAFEFRDSRISSEDFDVRSKELHNQISFSEAETRAFRGWAGEHIAMAENGEPKNPELRLRTKNRR
jgi:hypothetical protein